MNKRISLNKFMDTFTSVKKYKNAFTPPISFPPLSLTPTHTHPDFPSHTHLIHTHPCTQTHTPLSHPRTRMINAQAQPRSC